jgi:hypothetical protein
MTYPYAVKFNGKWYRPNEDVPDTANLVVETAKTVEESAIQPVISQVKEVQPESADVSEKAVEDEPKRRGRRRKDY